MAKLFEYQSKNILKKFNIKIPEGIVVSSPQEGVKAFEKLGNKPVVLKIQLWKTGRKGIGGVKFCESKECVKKTVSDFLKLVVDGFPVREVLVEKKLNVKNEFFAGIIIDDKEKKPVMLFSTYGGSGIEEIAKEYPESIVKLYIDVIDGLSPFQVRQELVKKSIRGKTLIKIGSILVNLYRAMREYDARSLEVNPLILTGEGEIFAADAHIVIDDYAVYRHKDLGIEIAREFPRPPTELEKIAYKVEEKDYRGTFYFIQMVEEIPGDGKHIGFHGAGGGGSMMSMDAVADENLIIANFTDTSGNPPASKVYRAAKIILSQPDIVGYFASGSGVASQEQFHSARGFVKAFLEEDIDIPAVLRLGGNYEEVAIEILEKYLHSKGYNVIGYGKNTSPRRAVRKLKEMIGKNPKFHSVAHPEEFFPKGDEYSFETMTGTIYIDHNACNKCKTRGCIDTCKYNVLKLENGKPVLAIDRENAKRGKCTECLACEIYCNFHEKGALNIVLPIPGLKEYRERINEHNS